MNRSPSAPDREDVAPHELAAYDRTVERISGYSEARKWGAGPSGIQPYYAMLLNSPEVADHVSGIPAVLRRRAATGEFPNDAQLEWADLVAARDMKWNRAFYSHVAEALGAGVRPEAIKALMNDRVEDLTDDERRLADYIGKVQRGTVADEDYAWLEAQVGTRGAVEYTVFVGFLMLNFRAMQAFGIADRSDQEVADLVEQLC